MFKMFHRTVGHATRMKPSEVEKQVNHYLIKNEKIYMAFKMLRDIVVFTQHRILIVDVMGVGVKKGIKSIPYKSISRFEIHTSGAVDINTELMIWIGFPKEPQYTIVFASGDENLLKVQELLASAVLLA